jgi:hypothetical protein
LNIFSRPGGIEIVPPGVKREKKDKKKKPPD